MIRCSKTVICIGRRAGWTSTKQTERILAGQFNQIREEEEVYLRRKKMAADLDERARRAVLAERSAQEQAELVEQARLEQRRQLDRLASERREKMRLFDERAKLARLEQIQTLEIRGEDQGREATAKQRQLLVNLDKQLQERVEEEEEWMRSRIEAESLQEIEMAAVSRLRKQMIERQNEATVLQVIAKHNGVWPSMSTLFHIPVSGRGWLPFSTSGNSAH